MPKDAKDENVRGQMAQLVKALALNNKIAGSIKMNKNKRM